MDSSSSRMRQVYNLHCTLLEGKVSFHLPVDFPLFRKFVHALLCPKRVLE